MGYCVVRRVPKTTDDDFEQTFIVCCIYTLGILKKNGREFVYYLCFSA